MTRAQTHSNPVADECGEAKTAHVVVGVFVVSGGDAAKVLEAPEHTLNDVSVSARRPERLIRSFSLCG